MPIDYYKPKDDRRNLAIMVGVTSGYALVGAVLLATAAHLHGPWRYVLGALGLIGVGFAGLVMLSLTLFVLGWGAVTGTFRAKPSRLQRSVWLIAALVAGALLGSLTYEAGPPALATGPVVLVAAWTGLRIAATTPALSDMPQHVDRRIRAFAAVSAVSAVGVGLTIFL